MTDFETANQITDIMGLFLESFALLTTVIFAYVTGAFYFLHRAPMFTKVVSFVFLMFAVTFVLINLVGAFFHYMALVEQVDQQVTNPSVSLLIQSVHTGRTRPMAQAGLWTIVPVILGTLSMCFWMTFFWKPD
jgi:hypothetical protein